MMEEKNERCYRAHRYSSKCMHERAMKRKRQEKVAKAMILTVVMVLWTATVVLLCG